MTKLHQVAELGQAIWLDYIQRSLIATGQLRQLMDEGVRGVTSNPSIFRKAIAGSSDYQDDLVALAADGKDTSGIYECLAVDDIRAAADVLRPLYDSSDVLDGYVSIEVSPLLAYDTAATIAEAHRLWEWIDRPNVFIKVPATPEGYPAIEELVSSGINVNVTLIFSLEQYQAIAEAYISGLEKASVAGRDIRTIRSVASLFVSRVDGKVDPLLAERGEQALLGKIALANAKVCYQLFKQLFSGDRWNRLAGMGAYVQRPLWASTSAKNPAYPKTLYVDNLIGPFTVNTAPPATIEAYKTSGRVEVTVEEGLKEAQIALDSLPEVGIDLDAIMAQLLDEGVVQFENAYKELLATIEERAAG